MNRLNPLPGGGPWRILPECPSPILHNTQHAGTRQKAHLNCCCPRTQAIKRERVQRSHAARTAARAARRNEPPPPVVEIKPVRRFDSGMPKEHTIRPPQFHEGMCRDRHYSKIVDDSFTDQGSVGGIKARQRMKDLCSFCPLVRQCAEYVLAAESPAGSWGGVYGGLDVWNRRGEALVVGADAVHKTPFSAQGYLASLPS